MHRRDFLKTASLSGAGVALFPLSAISLDNEWYTNSRRGIRMRTPPGWHFIQVKDFERHVEEQWDRLEDGEELKKLLGDVDEPILVLSKYRRPEQTDVCPSIQICGESLHYASHDLVRDLRFLEWRLRSYHRDYELEQEPAPATIGGIDGAAITYRFSVAEIGRRRQALRAWEGVVRAPAAEFAIAMIGAAEGNDACPEEFREARDSFVFSEVT